MSPVRKYGLRQQSPCFFIFLLCLAFSVALSAQESAREKEKEREKKEAAKKSANMVDVVGTLRCEKADPRHQLDVPDREGHSLIVEQRKCTWTEPWKILKGRPKEGIWMAFTERMEGGMSPHSFEVDTLDDGEKITFQTTGHFLADKGPTTAKGRFSFMRGTGKYKGIRGGGTYEGQLGADDILTLKLEGVYMPSAMATGKK